MTPARYVALAIAILVLDTRAAESLRGSASTTPPCFGNHFILDEPCVPGWRPASRGLGDLDVYILGADPADGMTLYAGGASGLFKSVDGGENWKMSGLDLKAVAVADTTNAHRAFPRMPSSFVAASILTSVAVDSAHPGTLYAATRADKGAWYAQRRFFKSTDGAETWTDSLSPFINGVDNIHSLAMAPADPSTLYLSNFDDSTGDTWSPMVKTTDGAATWTYLPYLVVNVLAVDPLDARTVYAGTFAFPPQFTDLPDGVLKSTDGGETWQPTGLTGPGISTLAIARTAPGTLYAATSSDSAGEIRNRLFRTVDGGLTWARADTGLGDFPLAAVIVDPGDSSKVYAAAFGAGVARSVDGGITWTTSNDGLPDLFVRTLLFVPGDPGALYAGTRSGVFKLVE